MNPPIRSAADRDALLEGLLDGTIDCIATDMPPTPPRKNPAGLQGSLNGIVGLECAFSVLYTQLVEPAFSLWRSWLRPCASIPGHSSACPAASLPRVLRPISPYWT